MSDSSVKQYCGLMQEIQNRVSAIRLILEENVSLGFVNINAETVYLQFRKILELIAYASLVANFKIYSAARNDHSTEWHAKRFLKKIESLNAEFYPDPLKFEKVEEAPERLNFVGLEEGFLTREQFETLYDQCGAFMHSENPYGDAHRYTDLLEQAPSWLMKITSLLNAHHIRLVDGESWLILMPGEVAPIYMVLDKA